MGQIITSPAEAGIELMSSPAIFLAGGITDCPDWQTPVAEELANALNITVVNPRRSNWNMESGHIDSIKQITWEYAHLRMCSHTLFWFPCETMCPITLFELGSALERETTCFIGAHPDYQRKFDVEYQALLRAESGRKDCLVYDDLDTMTFIIIERLKAQGLAA